MRQHLHLQGAGEVFPYCCNSDFCNADMCKAMGLPTGHNLCTTTMEHKLREQQLIQQPPKPKPQNEAILNAVSRVAKTSTNKSLDFQLFAEC